jgi:hypothetical protein
MCLGDSPSTIAVLTVVFKNLRRDCIVYARRPPALAITSRIASQWHFAAFGSIAAVVAGCLERLEPDLREQLEKFLRLARLCAFTRSDRPGPCKRRGTGGAAGAVMAHGLEKSGQRARRALPRIPRLRYRSGGGTKADRRLNAAFLIASQISAAVNSPTPVRFHPSRKKRRSVPLSSPVRQFFDHRSKAGRYRPLP